MKSLKQLLLSKKFREGEYGELVTDYRTGYNDAIDDIFEEISQLEQSVSSQEVIDFIKRRGDYTYEEMQEIIGRIKSFGIKGVSE